MPSSSSRPTPRRRPWSDWPSPLPTGPGCHVQLDTDWVRRVDAFVRIGKLVVSLLAGIFGAALVLATFNTIRLQILAHAAEIEVARLIGATDGWIRRPFAYYGALQGCAGRIARIRLHQCRQMAAGTVDCRTCATL